MQVFSDLLYVESLPADIFLGIALKLCVNAAYMNASLGISLGTCWVKVIR